MNEPTSCKCGQCGADLVEIGEDISKQPDGDSARFFVHRHTGPQYAWRPCETVSAVRILSTVIDGGMAAVGLLAWVASSKYLAHLPIYQIEQIAARHGAPLADWLAELLQEPPCLHADETPLRQLDPGSGKTKHAYLWTYRSQGLDVGPSIVVFDYQTSRAGAHARVFLRNWRGHLRRTRRRTPEVNNLASLQGLARCRPDPDRNDWHDAHETLCGATNSPHVFPACWNPSSPNLPTRLSEPLRGRLTCRRGDWPHTPCCNDTKFEI